MITELKPTNLIAVEVPKDSFGFYTTYEDKYTSLWLLEPKNEYEIFGGKVNEPYPFYPALFETSRSEDVPEINILGEVTKDKIGFDVEKLGEVPLTSKEANELLNSNDKIDFRKLLAANGLHFENHLNWEKKAYLFKGSENSWGHDDLARWQSFEDKLIKGKLLILEKH